MTERERACLEYLNDKMEANARMIGIAIYTRIGVDGMSGGFTAVGAAICVQLRRRGLVTRLPDLAAWRITAAGREALNATRAIQQKAAADPEREPGTSGVA